MIAQEMRDTLLLFCEKVEKVVDSSAKKALEQGKAPFRFSARTGEPVLIETDGPTDESVEAFVLTLRFFIQDNESISIRNTCKLIETLPISDTIKERVRERRSKFNKELDAKCQFQINGKHLTYREIYDVFIYGHLAHANADKREIYAEWTKNPVALGLMSAVFWQVLSAFIVMVAFLRANIHEAMAELKLANKWP